jgi:hypothetical protein
MALVMPLLSLVGVDDARSRMPVSAQVRPARADVGQFRHDRRDAGSTGPR